MAETKRGRGRPKKEEQIILTKDQKIALLELMLATCKVMHSYEAMVHPSIDEIINLDNARIKAFSAFPYLLEEQNK